MEKYNKNSIFLGLGLALFVLFVLWQQSSPQTTTNKVTYGEVDKVRKQEVTKSKMQREKMNVENYKNAPQISESYRPQENTNANEGLRLEASVSAAAKDIAEGELGGMAVESLENKINQRLLNEQKTAQMNVIQKKQFADEYKKKALSMGYAVELNDKLEITKVQKIEPVRTIKSNPVIDVDSMEEDEEQ